MNSIAEGSGRKGRVHRPRASFRLQCDRFCPLPIQVAKEASAVAVGIAVAGTVAVAVAIAIATAIAIAIAAAAVAVAAVVKAATGALPRAGGSERDREGQAAAREQRIIARS